MIRKVLVANRGEIAVRIVRALRDLGLESAVIYSDADRTGLPVLLADEAYRIGPVASRESYLDAEGIVRLAAEIGADAIHPGYGFLAENARFAALTAEAGLTFIGPPPEAMAVMGSKIDSRRRMREAGVPVIPGGERALETLEEARREAAGVGYPVMLKASAGGGGKGMRHVESPAEIESAYRAARSEAAASFGDDAVYIEKAIVEPRHVEIQVFGDAGGRVVSLGERECSMQRRHQKVVEEAPSPVVTPELRRAMGDAAVAAAEAVGYTNAGTVEFLLDAEGDFYFLEMNTRLQVEHPVTELVTGLDLVALQLVVAQGGSLPEGLENLEPHGHAIEVRLYAEDPYRGFAPSPGVIELLRWPEGPGVRVDAGVYEGAEVTVHYDPLLAKLICWGEDREQAMRRLERALREMRIEGIQTTKEMFQALLTDEDFRRGRLDIGLLDRKLAAGDLDSPYDAASSDVPLLAAAIEHVERSSRAAAVGARGGGGGARSSRERWRQAGRRESMGPRRWSRCTGRPGPRRSGRSGADGADRAPR